MKRWHFTLVGKGLFFNKQCRKNSLATWKKGFQLHTIHRDNLDGLKIYAFW